LVFWFVGKCVKERLAIGGAVSELLARGRSDARETRIAEKSLITRLNLGICDVGRALGRAGEKLLLATCIALAEARAEVFRSVVATGCREGY
tara:strand:+ start:4562 stop:4837 length:276 start_codon:yes stop_codon:yes gene_type:complete